MNQALNEIEQNLPTLEEIRAIPAFKPLKPKQKKFIIAYAGTGRITTAAAITKVPWISHYNWINRDERYKEAWDKAREIFGDYAEGEVFNRAFFGEEHRVFKRGELIDTYMQKSDILAMFALKGLKPQYRDNFSINQFAGPVQLNVKLDSQAVDPLQLSGNQALLNQGNTDK